MDLVYIVVLKDSHSIARNNLTPKLNDISRYDDDNGFDKELGNSVLYKNDTLKMK